jgi:hypothetical protein
LYTHPSTVTWFMIQPMRALKSSTDSPSLNVSESNSYLREFTFAFHSRSTLMLRKMIASHAAFVVGLIAIDPIISTSTTLEITSRAMRSSI